MTEMSKKTKIMLGERQYTVDTSEPIDLGGKKYHADSLSEVAISNLLYLQFSADRVKELNTQLLMLQKAKNGFIQDLKKEILSSKTGLLLDDI